MSTNEYPGLDDLPLSDETKKTKLHVHLTAFLAGMVTVFGADYNFMKTDLARLGDPDNTAQQ